MNNILIDVTFKTAIANVFEDVDSIKNEMDKSMQDRKIVFGDPAKKVIKEIKQNATK